jgi:hypothetical protein
VVWIGESKLMPEKASVGDPIDAMERAKWHEPELQKLATILSAANATIGGERWRVAELIKKSEMAEAGGIGQHAVLREVLEDIAGDHGKVNSRKLGRWIEKQADRPCGGMWFKRAGERPNTALWRIEGKPSANA